MCCVRGPSWSTGRIAGAGINRQPQEDAPVWRSGAGCAARRSSRCGRCRWQKQRSCQVRACSPARVSHVVMVACRKPCDPLGSEIGSNPSASAVSTMAICCEGVFTRYKGVLRRALKVVRQAGPRKVWICSTCPCLPSPTSAWICSSVIPK